MDKQQRRSIKTAAIKREMISVQLKNGESIKGIAEVSADAERLKINTIDGPVWVFINDITDISRVIEFKTAHQS